MFSSFSSLYFQNKHHPLLIPIHVYLPHIESTVTYHIAEQYFVNSGPEFAGCPDEDGELYEDCTLTE